MNFVNVRCYRSLISIWPRFGVMLVTSLNPFHARLVTALWRCNRWLKKHPSALSILGTMCELHGAWQQLDIYYVVCIPCDEIVFQCVCYWYYHTSSSLKYIMVVPNCIFHTSLVRTLIIGCLKKGKAISVKIGQKLSTEFQNLRQISDWPVGTGLIVL